MGYWRFTTEFSGFGIWCRRLALPQKPLGHALADALQVLLLRLESRSYLE
jgi:hypothetical protein